MILFRAEMEGANEKIMKTLKSHSDKCIKLLSEITASTQLDREEKKKSILIVEDDLIILEMLEERLKRAGYKIFRFSDPKESLQWLSEKTAKIDVLVVDYRMPDINGSELISRAREFVGKNIPAILISAQEIPEENMEGIKVFIEKPMVFADLLEAIESS